MALIDGHAHFSTFDIAHMAEERAPLLGGTLHNSESIMVCAISRRLFRGVVAQEVQRLWWKLFLREPQNTRSLARIRE